MPPMSGAPPIGASSFGSSATMASVVTIRPATEAAVCATRYSADEASWFQASYYTINRAVN